MDDMRDAFVGRDSYACHDVLTALWGDVDKAKYVYARGAVAFAATRLLKAFQQAGATVTPRWAWIAFTSRDDGDGVSAEIVRVSTETRVSIWTPDGIDVYGVDLGEDSTITDYLAVARENGYSFDQSRVDGVSLLDLTQPI